VGSGSRNADDLTTLVASVFVFLSLPRGCEGWLRRGGLAVAAAAVRSVTCALREGRGETEITSLRAWGRGVSVTPRVVGMLGCRLRRGCCLGRWCSRSIEFIKSSIRKIELVQFPQLQCAKQISRIQH
jgi:hypothetical protein